MANAKIEKRDGKLFLVADRGELRHHLVERADERKLRAVDFAEAVLGLDEDRLRGAGGEGGLADAFRAVDHDARRLRLPACLDLLQQ